MSHLILVRHGKSEWNLENRFTGWVDVDLAPKGKLEACKAGELIKKLDLSIGHFFSSYQKRAIDTLKLILNTMRIKDDKIVKAWELNERHYGSLTGLNKNNPYHPLNIEIYKDIPKDKIPDTESLKDTYDRVIPYFKKNIEKKISENVMISAHGNSIRSLCKYLFDISNEEISKLEIPTGNPLILKFDDNIKLLNAKYLDKERAKDLLKFG